MDRKQSLVTWTIDGWVEDEIRRLVALPWVRLIEIQISGESIVTHAAVNKLDPRGWWYRLTKGTWW